MGDSIPTEEKLTVKDEIIKLDYSRLENTRFVGCKMIYEGGRPPSMIGCDFVECEWIFEGPAMNTLAFMHFMANSGPGGDDLVIHGLLGLEGWAKK